MSLLKLETHFFTKNMKTPEQKDIAALMGLFSSDELMPQYYEERNIIDSSSTKNMMFVNPIEGKSIRFLADRVVITNEFNPFNSLVKETFAEKLATFQEFYSNNIKAYEKYYGSELLGNRAALVVSVVITNILTDSKERFAETLHASLPWKSSNYYEVKLRTGEKIENVIEGENLNFITSIDDGFIEQNQNGQLQQKKNCYLVQLDLSTDNLNNESRINIKKFDELIQIFSTHAETRQSEVNSFFEGQ